MKNKDLIQLLLMQDPEQECMILDGNNGGGEPREINLGPVNHLITPSNADNGCDCEGKSGLTVTIIGYGCY